MPQPALDLLLRVLVVALIAVLILALRPLLAAGQDARRRRALASQALSEWRTGRPLVLLFTGAVCSDCLRQKDVLARLDLPGDGLAVREVVAAQAPDLTRRFGIRGVPSTVVIDGDGRPTAVNYGLVDASTLLSQLAG
jgi:thioredoxin-like negative regulator of GroEL